MWFVPKNALFKVGIIISPLPLVGRYRKGAPPPVRRKMCTPNLRIPTQAQFKLACVTDDPTYPTDRRHKIERLVMVAMLILWSRSRINNCLFILGGGIGSTTDRNEATNNLRWWFQRLFQMFTLKNWGTWSHFDFVLGCLNRLVRSLVSEVWNCHPKMGICFVSFDGMGRWDCFFRSSLDTRGKSVYAYVSCAEQLLDLQIRLLCLSIHGHR